jgi:hypothetical protein
VGHEHERVFAGDQHDWFLRIEDETDETAATAETAETDETAATAETDETAETAATAETDETDAATATAPVRFPRVATLGEVVGVHELRQPVPRRGVDRPQQTDARLVAWDCRHHTTPRTSRTRNRRYARTHGSTTSRNIVRHLRTIFT